MKKIEVFGLQTIPEIKPGDALPKIVLDCATQEGCGLKEKDIVVLTSKILSKSMGLMVKLEEVRPSEKAVALGKQIGKDPRIIQLIWNLGHEIIAAIPVSGMVVDSILGDCTRRQEAGVLCDKEGAMCVTRDPAGRIFTQESGIDGSNHPKGIVSIPPPDPDEAAEAVREEIRNLTGVNVAVIIADTELIGMGTLDVAIGSSGINPRPNYFGHTDSFGKPKFGGMDIVAHELTCASALLFGQLTAAIPAVIVRGYECAFDEKATIANTLWGSAGTGQWRQLLKDTLRATACVKPLPTRLALKLLSWFV